MGLGLARHRRLARDLDVATEARTQRVHPLVLGCLADDARERLVMARVRVSRVRARVRGRGRVRVRVRGRVRVRVRVMG